MTHTKNKSQVCYVALSKRIVVYLNKTFFSVHSIGPAPIALVSKWMRLASLFGISIEFQSKWAIKIYEISVATL